MLCRQHLHACHQWAAKQSLPVLHDASTYCLSRLKGSGLNIECRTTIPLFHSPIKTLWRKAGPSAMQRRSRGTVWVKQQHGQPTSIFDQVADGHQQALGSQNAWICTAQMAIMLIVDGCSEATSLSDAVDPPSYSSIRVQVFPDPRSPEQPEHMRQHRATQQSPSKSCSAEEADVCCQTYGKLTNAGPRLAHAPTRPCT